MHISRKHMGSWPFPPPFPPNKKQALFAIFVQYDANLDGQVRGSESKQLLKAGGIGGISSPNTSGG